MTPVYDGKGQPPNSPGWFSGVTAWWNRLTPTYVTLPSRSAAAAPRGYISSPTTPRPSEAPTSAADKAATSPSTPSTTASSTSATKP